MGVYHSREIYPYSHGCAKTMVGPESGPEFEPVRTGPDRKFRSGHWSSENSDSEFPIRSGSNPENAGPDRWTGISDFLVKKSF